MLLVGRLSVLSLPDKIENTSHLAIVLAGNPFLASTGVINVLQSICSLSGANPDIMDSRITRADTLQVATFNDGSNNFARISGIPEPSAALIGSPTKNRT